MSALRFTWDLEKAAGNARKHGVTFEEAESVFLDPLAAIHDDVAHSGDEPREIIVGHSSTSQLLLVCFTERPDGVRLISARQATSRERRDYEQR